MCLIDIALATYSFSWV